MGQPHRFSRRRLLLIAVLLTAALTWWESLPTPLFHDPFSVVLLDRGGRLLGARIASDQQWRFPPAEEVPTKYRQALIQFEDKRFPWHPGVDPLALLRAVRLNLRQHSVVSGGSTLTMQVIRLARHNPPRNYWEKFKEVLLALRLEVSFSKEQILALYAGHAPFGGNVVGLEAAAWRYFGRRPDQLSWAESCMLAVLPNNPAMIHPGRNREALMKARNRLLQRLAATGNLDPLELNLALAEPLPEQPHPMPRLAPHLLDTLAGHGHHGNLLSVLDADLQQNLNRIMGTYATGLAQRGIRNGAAIVVDNRTFEVKAYLGNSRYDQTPGSGNAIDLLHRPRSTGSLLKPLLYASMLQDGAILPGTLVPDLPTYVDGYNPENYDRTYRGAVPAKTALARSLNVPAVRMLSQYGLARFYDTLKAMGLTTLFRPPDDYGLTLILGGAEGTLWELVQVYANLAAIARDRPTIKQQRYRKLVILADAPSSSGELTGIGPGAAWLTLEALDEVSRPGGDVGWRQFSSAARIAWKTGTSYGLRDGWAIGSTAAYTVGIWVGNCDGEGVPDLTGVGAAAPLMLEIFKVLPAADWFAPPYTDLKTVQVCGDDGYLASPDCTATSQLVPATSHFDQLTPNHLRIQLDVSGNWRVDSSCEAVANMRPQNWFILPPGQEHFYRRQHPEYRLLPPFRPDCASPDESSPMAILYPEHGSRLFIPKELDGTYGRSVFEAVHRRPGATLHWHLDESYLGETQVFHQQAVYVRSGLHRLTLVDDRGQTLVRTFEVIAR